MEEGPVDVLVVDDDEAVRTSWVDILRTAGWAVEEAPDAFAALQRLREMSVGVIVLDVRMPGLDGLGLIDRLDESPPVILVAANHYEADVVVRRDKIHTFILKPVVPDRLIAAVAAALETDPTARLSWVRDQLDILCERRDRDGWTEDEARRYEQLCAEEASLISQRGGAQ